MSFFYSLINRRVLLLVLLFAGFGLVQIYSASYIFSTEKYHDGLFFFKKQMIFSLLGLAVLLFLATISWKWAQFLGISLWVLSVLLLIATLVPGIGVTAGGAQRWIDLPFGFRFQPAELFKVSSPFAFMYLIALREQVFFRSRPLLFWMFPVFAFTLPILVLALQPDFGTIVLFLCLTLSVVFILGLKWRYIFASLFSISLMMYLMIVFTPYRMARIKAVMNPWSDPLETGFQVIQSMISFHSGGMFGVGLGHGQGKLFFLPEAHTDFTLAVFGEETGFIGFSVLLTLYALLVYYGIKISLRTKDLLQKILAFSLTMTFAFSIMIHVGVNLGMFPPKGLTLPFMSYGGSALVCSFLLFGWLLNIEKHNHFVY